MGDQRDEAASNRGESEEALRQLRTYTGPPAVIPVVRAAAAQAGVVEVAGDYSPTLVLPPEVTVDGSINDDTPALPGLSPRAGQSPRRT